MDRIAIIGTGLIGTSLGLAIKQARLPAELTGFDISRRASAAAEKMGAVDKSYSYIDDALKGARLVIVATPVHSIREVLEFIAPLLEEGAVVTDTGSTKTAVLDWAEQYLPRSVSFVGGHPMAGSEQSGPKAARAGLFQGAVYAVCPGRDAHPQAVRNVVNIVEAIGAKAKFIDPVEHDSYVAAISHLPMLFSVALVACTSKSPGWREMSKLAASGYRDISRLASGDPLVNLGICETNQDNVTHWIDESIKQLYELRRLVKEDKEGLEKLFISAWESRAKWLAGVDPETRPGTEIPSWSKQMESLLLGEYVSKGVRRLPSDQDTTEDKTKYRRR